MKFFTRLSPLAVSALALSVAVYLAFWGLSAPTAAADEGEFAYWDYSGSPEVCDFQANPDDPPGTEYVCADWITAEGPQHTCCIDEDNIFGEAFDACLTIISMPSTAERPGL